MNLRPHIKKNGFASITLLLFLPLICLIVFTFSFVCYLIQYKTKMRSFCLYENISIQRSLIENEEKLFKLNPLAQSLRLRLKVTYAELALALANQNFVLARQLNLKIAEIKSEQKKLDQLQKLIIRTAELNLTFRSTQLLYNLTNLSQQMSSIWSFYINSLTTTSLLKKSKVSVKPDSPDLAPIYELTDDYSEQQRLVYSWQNQFSINSRSQSYIKSENEFEMYCESTEKKERGLWTILINEDRS